MMTGTILGSALLCMVDSVLCMILVENMVLVLQKSKQAKSRVDLKGKRVDKKNEKVSLSGIQTLNAWVAVRLLLC